MSTLSQYFRGSFSKRTLEHCYYICGNSLTGIEMVVEDIIYKSKLSAVTLHLFSAVYDSFDNFYGTLQTRTIDTNLVILRDAEILTEEQWDRIQDWYGRSSTTILVIVTNEVIRRNKSERPERVKWFVDKGKFVQAHKFSTTESAKNFITFYLDCTEIFADFILERVGFDSEKILEQLRLLRMTKTQTVKDAVKLVPDTTSRNLVDMLYDRDPKLRKLKLTSQETIRFIDAVEQDIILQLRVLQLSRQSRPNFEISAALNITPGHANKLLKRAIKINGNLAFARLDLITRAQHYYNEYGARLGVYEWFIKMWRLVR